MSNFYKKIEIHFAQDHGGETQVYLAKEEVTAEQIMSGDDTGVVCLCVDPSMADALLSALNTAAACHA